MSKKQMINDLADGKTIVFSHGGFQHSIGLDLINPALRDKMSYEQRLAWADGVVTDVMKEYGIDGKLPDAATVNNEQSKVLNLQDTKRKIEIMRGFDELKNLPDSEILTQIDELPEPYMLAIFSSYQAKGITSYYEALEDLLNMAEHALQGKGAPPSLLDE